MGYRRRSVGCSPENLEPDGRTDGEDDDDGDDGNDPHRLLRLLLGGVGIGAGFGGG